MPKVYPYEPDYAVCPGAILEERMEVHGLSPAELARRWGAAEAFVRGIISGNIPIDPETAHLLEETFDLDAVVWLGIEANYRSKLSELKAKKAANHPAKGPPRLPDTLISSDARAKHWIATLSRGG